MLSLAVLTPAMPLCNPADLRALIPMGKRLLGLDIGTKTIGMALSDTTWMIATPLDTIRRAKFKDDVKRLVAEIERHQIGGLVAGLPIGLDGREGPRAQGVRQVARNLLEHVDLPLTFWDERLSTAAVERGMIEGDLSRKRRAEIIDKVAAAYILQGLLDCLGRMETPEPT